MQDDPHAMPTQIDPAGPPPPLWVPILTIKVSRRDNLWAAWRDDVRGVLVCGHSLAEVLEKFPAAHAEVEAARANAT